mmetsp:Transcript_19156/g.30874  ORF Transcript_19156/g.30874 Transcript_19156/m.30874 type:complete len:460 (-) Transcript_19156:1155-2534(-)
MPKNSNSKLDYLSKYTNDDSKKKKKDRKKKKKKERPVLPSSDYHDEDDEYLQRQLPYSNDDDDDRNDIPGVGDDDEGPVVVDASEVIHADPATVASSLAQPRGVWEDDTNGPASGLGRVKQEDSDDQGSAARRQQSKSRRQRHDSSDEDEAAPTSSNADGYHDSHKKQRRRRHDSSSDESSIRNQKMDRKRRHDSSSEDDDSVDERRERRRPRYDSSDEEEAKPQADAAKSSRVEGTQKRRRYDSSSEDDDDDNGRARMSSGHRAGLQHYNDFTESELKIQARKHKEAQNMVDKYGMGETVYRDKDGRRADPSKMGKSREIDPEEQRRLNQGKVQQRELEAKAQEMAILKETSFARHQDDERLEELRKNEIRKDDPMAAYAAKKQTKSRKVGSGGVASVEPSKPVYKGPPPKPNRYGIRPGYRWDGVDRGNGWEDKLLAQKYSASRKEEQAYRWRSADM